MTPMLTLFSLQKSCSPSAVVEQRPSELSRADYHRFAVAAVDETFKARFEVGYGVTYPRLAGAAYRSEILSNLNFAEAQCLCYRCRRDRFDILRQTLNKFEINRDAPQSSSGHVRSFHAAPPEK